MQKFVAGCVYRLPEILLGLIAAELFHHFASISGWPFSDSFDAFVHLTIGVGKSFAFIILAVHVVQIQMQLRRRREILKKFLLFSIGSLVLYAGLVSIFREQIFQPMDQVDPNFHYPSQSDRPWSGVDYDRWFVRWRYGEIWVVESLFHATFVLLTVATGIWTRNMNKAWLYLVNFFVWIVLVVFAILLELFNLDIDMFQHGATVPSILFLPFPFVVSQDPVGHGAVFIFVVANLLSFKGRIIIEPKRRSPYYSPPTSEAPSD